MKKIKQMKKIVILKSTVSFNSFLNIMNKAKLCLLLRSLKLYSFLNSLNTFSTPECRFPEKRGDSWLTES